MRSQRRSVAAALTQQTNLKEQKRKRPNDEKPQNRSSSCCLGVAVPRTHRRRLLQLRPWLCFYSSRGSQHIPIRSHKAAADGLFFSRPNRKRREKVEREHAAECQCSSGSCETPGPKTLGSGPAATRLKRSQMKRKHVKLPDRIMSA